MIGHAAFGPVETPYIMAGNNVGDRESYLPQSWNWEQEEEKGCGFTVLFEDVSSLLDNQDLPLGFTSLWVCVSAEIH